MTQRGRGDEETTPSAVADLVRSTDAGWPSSSPRFDDVEVGAAGEADAEPTEPVVEVAGDIGSIEARPSAATADRLADLEAELDELQARLDRASDASASHDRPSVAPPDSTPSAVDDAAQDGALPVEEAVVSAEDDGVPAVEEAVVSAEDGGVPAVEEAVVSAEDGGVPAVEDVVVSLEDDGVPAVEDVVVSLEDDGVPAVEEAEDAGPAGDRTDQGVRSHPATDLGVPGPLDPEAAAFLARLGDRPTRTPRHEGLSVPLRRVDAGIDWKAVVDAAPPVDAPTGAPDADDDETPPERSEGVAAAAPEVPAGADPAADARAGGGSAVASGGPVATDAPGATQPPAPSGPDDPGVPEDLVVDLRSAGPPPVAPRPARPPRLLTPEPIGARTGDPQLRATAARVAPDERAAAARSTIATTLVAAGLQADDLLVVDGIAGQAIDALAARLPDDVADELEARTLRTASLGEPIPLALALGWLPFAHRSARRIVSVVDHGELLAGPTWAALDAVGEARAAGVTVVVTIDPHELPRREQPDRAVQRWARRFLDLGWRAVDLRYGGRHRGGGAATPGVTDSADLARDIADGSISPGGNDLVDLEWLWDAIHRSSQPTVVFAYVAPPISHGSPPSPPPMVAIGAQLTSGRPLRPPSTFGLVRFDASDRGATSTEDGFLVGLEAMLAESEELAGRIALVCVGRRSMVAPPSVPMIEVRDASVAGAVVRAAGTLGHLPIVVGREEDLAPVAVALGQAIDAGSRAVLVGLASGHAASDRAAAARARRVPAIVTAIEGFDVVEPFAPAWVEAELRDALHRVETGGGSTYLRLNSLTAPVLEIDAARLAPGLRRGGVVLRQSRSAPAVALVAAGAALPATLGAADVLADQGIEVDVVALSAPLRLRRGAASLDQRPGTSELDQLIVPGRGHRLVVAVDDGIDLGWIGGAARVPSVGVSIADADSIDGIGAAAMAALDGVAASG